MEENKKISEMTTVDQLTGEELIPVVDELGQNKVIKSKKLKQEVDSSLSEESENPVQNKVIKSEFDKINKSIGDINTALDEINGEEI